MTKSTPTTQLEPDPSEGGGDTGGVGGGDSGGGGEEVLWDGSSSQIVNWLWWLLALTILLLPVTLYYWLRIRLRKYILTTERIVIREGILNVTTSYLELYRVRDVTLREPLVYRLIGCGDIVMQTSDRSHPQFIIPAIHNAAEVQELLRVQVEKMRQLKRVREVDFE